MASSISFNARLTGSANTWKGKVYLDWFYSTFAYVPNAITEVDINEYVRTYSQGWGNAGRLFLL